MSLREGNECTEIEKNSKFFETMKYLLCNQNLTKLQDNEFT